MSSVCSLVLQLTEAGLSRWHSPPQLLLSAQIQTGPDQTEQEQERWREKIERRKVGERRIDIGQRETVGL